MAATDRTLRTPTTPTGARVRAARGGVSGGAVFTGVVVAFGAMSLLTALVAGIVTLGLPETTPFPGTAIQGSLFAAILVVLVQVVSYMWGGYTAGRMARGAGLANGLLVPLVALLLVLVIGAVVAALGTTADFNLPFRSWRLPISGDVVVEWGAWMGIASVAAMFVGGAVGGMLGMRWHSRLEQEAVATPEMSDPRPAPGTTTP